MIEEHKAETVNNFKIFLRHHDLKIEVYFNQEERYVAEVPTVTIVRPNSIAQPRPMNSATLTGRTFDTPEEALFASVRACREGTITTDETEENIEIPNCHADLSRYSEVREWGVA